MQQSKPHSDEIIDAVLAEYPLVPLPPHLVGHVMQHVVQRPLVLPPEPFRLQLIDFIIPALVSIVIGLLLFLRPEVGIDTAELQAAWLQLQTRPLFYVSIVVLVGELALFALAGSWLWEERPFFNS